MHCSNNTLHFVHTVYFQVFYDSQNKLEIISLNSINQLVFVTELHYVYCKVGTEFF